MTDEHSPQIGAAAAAPAPLAEPPGSSNQPVKSLFVAGLKADEKFTSAFLVKQKEIRQKKSGDPYLSLILSDRTGDVDAKMWDNVAEVQDAFERDDFVKIRGLVSIYRNKPQVTIHKLRRLDEVEVDLADYLAASPYDVEQMFGELLGYVDAVSDPHLRVLLRSVLEDPDLAAALKRAPAAKSLHHAYFGGLLEHVCSLCRSARLIVQNYPQINLDLVIAGIAFHDLGKVFELHYERAFSYTTEGQLLGHMILVLEVLHRKLAAMPDFPRPLQVLLEHMIISHHGKYEFGSPKLPMFPEALLLHYLDDLDSKMHSMSGLLSHDSTVEGDWTSYSASLERPLLKLDRWLLNNGGEGAAPNSGEAATLDPAGATAGGSRQPDSPQVPPSSAPDLIQMAARLGKALKGDKR
jgi:3'-5' exoribonuclease